MRGTGAPGSRTALEELIFSRRMVRSFTDEAVDRDTVESIVACGVRAPSAGFSQGWDFVVLDSAGARRRFWGATTDPDGTPDHWLRGVAAAPVLIVCCSDPQRYLRRYAEPDKPWQDGSETHWPVPYWDVDTGMAAMLMLLAAQDAGLGSLFFGVPGERMVQVRTALRIPQAHRIVGVIAIGHAARTAPSGSTRSRRRRSLSEVLHRNGFQDPGA